MINYKKNVTSRKVKETIFKVHHRQNQEHEIWEDLFSRVIGCTLRLVHSKIGFIL